MLNIFNRKELLITHDIERYYQTMDILDSGEIEFSAKVRSATGTWGSPNREGTFGTNDNNLYEYRIYVRKKDYERASHMIHGIKI